MPQKPPRDKRIVDTTKEGILKKLANGTCGICRTIPAFEVTYGMTDGGATRIEGSYGSCIQKGFEREPSFIIFYNS